MSNLGQIRTNVRTEILEPTAGFWSDSEINRFINEAADDLTEAARVEAGPQSIPLVAGTDNYALATDFGRTRYVERETNVGSGLYVPLRAGELADRRSEKAIPTSYFIYNGRIYIAPTPDAAYNVRVWYYAAATTLVLDTDTPVIPTRFHRLLELFAVAQCKRKQNDPAYSTYIADYASGRADMIQKLTNRSQAQSFPVTRDDWYIPYMPDPRTLPGS